MLNEIIDRIKQFQKANSESVTKFAQSIGMSQTTVNNYILGSRTISIEFIDKIAQSYPDLSMDWLIRGEGPMFKQVETTDNQPQQASIGKAYYEQLAKDLAEMKQRMSEIENKVG